LRHATGASDIANRGKKYLGIRVFQGSRQVLRDGLFIIKAISGIEGGKFDHYQPCNIR